MKKLFNLRYGIYFILAVSAAAFLQSCAVSRPYAEDIVTVPDIVQMSKDRVPSKDIIRDIRKSHTVYDLKADQLVKLRDQGVQDSVLNYMADTKVKAIRQDQRYADSAYWRMGPGGFYYGSGWGWPYGYSGWGYGPGIVFDYNRGYGGGYHGYYHDHDHDGGGHYGGGSHGGDRR